MSKRDQGASVDYYIKRGYRPEAVRNYLSLLGWSPKDNREKMTIEETTKIFDLNNVVRSHATFDPDKLHWLNGEYARELGDEWSGCDLLLWRYLAVDRGWCGDGYGYAN